MKFIEIGPEGIVEECNYQVFKETMDVLDKVQDECSHGFTLDLVTININSVGLNWVDDKHSECCGGGGYGLMLVFEDGKVEIDGVDEPTTDMVELAKNIGSCIYECDFRDECGYDEDDDDDSYNNFEDDSEDESEGEEE
jgi:hypothetical protein